MKIEPNAKLFTCECGYIGYRWNNNNHCKRCNKEGKLVTLIKIGNKNS